MSTVHLHAAHSVLSRWYLAIWPPLVAGVALALPDRRWAPGVATLLSIALLGLAAGLAIAGRPADERLWRAIGRPVESGLGRTLAHGLLLAPAALVLDRWLVSELSFVPGAYAAFLLFLYGALCAGRVAGRVWAILALILAFGAVAFDQWLQVRAGTWSGTEDLRRAFATLGLGGLALGLLWDARLGTWGFAVKQRRAGLVAGPLLALLLVPPHVDRALGPVVFYPAGPGQLSADGRAALRVVVSDGHLYQGPSYALLWQDGLERRVGPGDVWEASFGPGGELVLVLASGERRIVETPNGTAGQPASSDVPRALSVTEGVVTAEDGARWTLPAELTASHRLPPMARLDTNTLRVLSREAIYDLGRDGSVSRRPLLGARPAD